MSFVIADVRRLRDLIRSSAMSSYISLALANAVAFSGSCKISLFIPRAEPRGEGVAIRSVRSTVTLCPVVVVTLAAYLARVVV
jgi:hypothetical protein